MIEDESWNVEATMHTIIHQQKDDFQLSNIDWDREIPINETTLKRCLLELANIIEEHGDIYLPIFERVHNELQGLQKRNELREYVRKISTKEAHL